MILCSAYAVQDIMKETLTQKLVDQLVPQSKRYKVWDRKLSGFFVVVNPTGRKGYWCFTRVRGRGTDYKVGSCDELTLKQAKELGADALIKAKKGVSSLDERRVKEAETLSGFLDARYRNYLLSNQKSAKTTLWILEVVFKKFLNLRLEEIDIGKVERWRVEHSSTLKSSTINRRTAALKAALNSAKAWGIISSNPLADLGLKKVIKHPVDFLSDTQLGELKEVLSERDRQKIQARRLYNEWLSSRGQKLLPDYDELECSHADYLTPLARLIMESGLRLSEALSLEWKDISSDWQTLTVYASKTQTYRVIPINSEAASLLRTLKRLNAANIGKDTKKVFVTSKGDHLKGVKTSWNGVRDKLSFNCDWRMLRRTFGSRLIKKGVSLYAVSQLLGHSSVKTTEEWYVGLDLESKRAAINTLDIF
jgi:integrase